MTTNNQTKCCIFYKRISIQLVDDEQNIIYDWSKVFNYNQIDGLCTCGSLVSDGLILEITGVIKTEFFNYYRNERLKKDQKKSKLF